MNTEVLDARPMVAAQGQAALAPGRAVTPMALLELAVANGADLDRLERLMALKERYDAAEALSAFTGAMTAFKAEPLEIFKRKTVSFVDRNGDETRYSHATLADVAEVVVPAMAKHELSHRWTVNQAEGRITVTCVVTHKQGHSERVEMTAAPDASGKKNAIQQVASAISYMQRYTLLAILGLATKDVNDDDGRGSGDPDMTPAATDAAVQKWIFAVNESKDVVALQATWAQALADVQGRHDRKAYDMIKAEVNAKLAKLQEGAQ